METRVTFYVIDADTSYRAFLGIYNNYVVPSTLHQCFKYKVDGDQKKIVGDLKPFSVKESHYAAAKSFVDSEEATSTSTSQSGRRKNGSLRVVLSGLQNRLKDPKITEVREATLGQTMMRYCRSQVLLLRVNQSCQKGLLHL